MYTAIEFEEARSLGAGVAVGAAAVAADGSAWLWATCGVHPSSGEAGSGFFEAFGVPGAAFVSNVAAPGDRRAPEEAGGTVARNTWSWAFQPFLVWQVTMKIFFPGSGAPNLAA